MRTTTKTKAHAKPKADTIAELIEFLLSQFTRLEEFHKVMSSDVIRELSQEGSLDR